jgi:hypothetical protein
MFHGNLQLICLKVAKYYIYSNNLEIILAPFEKASKLGVEIGFCETRLISLLGLIEEAWD